MCCINLTSCKIAEALLERTSNINHILYMLFSSYQATVRITKTILRSPLVLALGQGHCILHSQVHVEIDRD